MAPQFEFPVPVLSVAADAVRELEGQEALSGLWALFTKCKESIKDGHRLENISWRLWYRELALAAPGTAGTDGKSPRWSDTKHDECESSMLNEKAPARDVPQSGIPEPSPIHLRSPSISSTPSPTPRPTSLTRRNSSVGQMIVDILPSADSSNLLPMSNPCKHVSTPSILDPGLHPHPRPSSAPVAVTTPVLEVPPPSVIHPPPVIQLSHSTPPSTAPEALNSLLINTPPPLPVSAPVAVAGPAISIAEACIIQSNTTQLQPICSLASTSSPPSTPSGPGPQTHTRPGSATPHSYLPPQPPTPGERNTPPPPPEEVTITPPPLALQGSGSHPAIITTTPPPPGQLSSTTATPTSHPLLPRLVIVHPTPGATPHPTPPATPRLGPRRDEQVLPTLVDSESGGLLTPSESSFSGITDTSVETVDTTPASDDDEEDVAMEVKSDELVDSPVASVEPERPTLTLGKSAGHHRRSNSGPKPERHVRKSSTSSAPGGETAAQTKAAGARSRARGTARAVGRHQSTSTSRSRSPGRGSGGVGGLMMAMTAVVDNAKDPSKAVVNLPVAAAKKPAHHGHGPLRVVGKRPGLGGMGIKRSMSAGRVGGLAGGAVGANAKGKEKDKKAAFNVGSNSEEGSGTVSHAHSKSVGSGSEGGKKVDAGEAPARVSTLQGLTATQQLPPTKQPQPQNLASLTTEAPTPPPQPAPSAASQVEPPEQQHQPRRLVLATDDSDDYETDAESAGGSKEGRESPIAKQGLDKKADEEEEKEKEGPEADDAEWASEDMSADEKPKTKGGSPSRQQHKAGSKHGGGSAGRLKQHHHAQPHPPPVQQRQPSNQNLNAQHPPPRTARQAQAQAQALRAKHTIEQAALEAQRLREMFVKKPVPSSEQLAAMRSKSVGLLSQLLNPDPRIFPVDHPYRRGFSSADVAAGGRPAPRRSGLSVGAPGAPKISAITPIAPVVPVAPIAPIAPVAPVDPRPAPRPEVPKRRHASADYGAVRQLTPLVGVGAPGLKLAKSSAALPVASQVQVGSFAAVTAQATKSNGSAHTSPIKGDGQASTNGPKNPRSPSHGVGSGYRPRGRPADQELEDTESESEAEAGNGKNNAILLSKSVAQEKLKALAERRGIKPAVVAGGNARADDEDGKPSKGHEQEPAVPGWRRAETTAGNPDSNGKASASRHLQHQGGRNQQTQQQLAQLYQQQPRYATNPPPAPIPVGHPYNLPPPAPPSTPRTTRRLMLQTEMSESLRRNLLWERQVSKVNIHGFRRTHSSGGAAAARPGGSGRGGGGAGAGLEPYVGLPPVVQLTAKKGKGSAGEMEEGRDEPPKPLDPEENMRRALARTKSWANDFHYSGW